MAANEPIMAGVAGRYAAALFELAQEENAADAVERDLVNIQASLNESEDFSRLVKSPVFSAEDQERALGAVLDHMGAGGLTKKFFGLIARNRRLFAAPDIIRAFRTLTAQRRGEVTAEVVSAHPLNHAQTGALKDALRASVGKDVQLDAKVDPSLIGGLIVKVGSRMIDSSLKSKFAALEASLKEAG